MTSVPFSFTIGQDKLKAIAVNVACPSQVVEGQSSVNADFWLPVRNKLKARYGEGLVVLGWGAAAGDMSPRPLLHKAANARMRALRGIDEMQELARRIDLSVSQTFEAVQQEKLVEPILRHCAVTLQLPLNKISESQYRQALAEYNNVIDQVEKDPSCAARVAFMARDWHHGVVQRYEQLQKDPDATYPVEIHVVRIGDVAICSNPFELFCEYGIRIKARSKATQTFILQMSGFGSYLPTDGPRLPVRIRPSRKATSSAPPGDRCWSTRRSESSMSCGSDQPLRSSLGA